MSRAKETVTFAGKITIGILSLAMVIYYMLASGFIAMFIKNEVIIAYGSAFLRGMCLGLPFLGMDFLAVGVFQACGMGKLSFCFAVLRKIVLEIPLLIALNYFFPLYGLAYAQFIAEVVLAIAAVVVLIRLFGGKSEEKA
jgi:Na+-driven multidrug efflux pump